MKIVCISMAMILIACITQPTLAQAPTPALKPALEVPEASESQNQSLKKQIDGKVLDARIKVAREEASQIIETVVKLQSCYTGWDTHKYLGQYFASGTADSFHISSPMVLLKYHSKSQCLTVSRLDNWKMNAKNVLSFKALLLSDESGESKTLNYEVVKQVDGNWLFTKASL